jgi:hypothetical protein
VRGRREVDATQSGGTGEHEQQRLAALRLANNVRRARAELKREIAGARVSLADTLANPPPMAQSSLLAELLMSQPRWGRAKTRKFLTANQIGERKALQDLTQRQRELLVAQLPHAQALAAED